MVRWYCQEHFDHWRGVFEDLEISHRVVTDFSLNVPPETDDVWS